MAYVSAVIFRNVKTNMHVHNPLLTNMHFQDDRILQNALASQCDATAGIFLAQAHFAKMFLHAAALFFPSLPYF